jgi:hypothetical protein
VNDVIQAVVQRAISSRAAKGTGIHILQILQLAPTMCAAAWRYATTGTWSHEAKAGQGIGKCLVPPSKPSKDTIMSVRKD